MRIIRTHGLLAAVLALAAAAAAVTARWLLDPVLHDALPLVTLYGAVAFGVWAGGYRSALVAVIGGYLACAYLFIPPRGSVVPRNARELVGLTAYLVTCGIIIAFGEALRAALRRQANRARSWRTTLASIADAVVMTDDRGCVSFMNAAAETLTGWTKEQARARPLVDVLRIVQESDRTVAEDPVTGALRSGKVIGLGAPALLVSRDGSEYPVEATAAPILDASRPTIGCVLVFRDVTESRREEALRRKHFDQLEAAEARTRSVIDNLVDGIITIDDRGIVQSFSGAAERLFGWTAGEVIGENVRMLMPEPYRSSHDRYISNYLATGQAKIIGIGREIVGRRKDGSTFPMDLAVSEFRIGGKRCFSGIIRDITARKEIEADLREKAELLDLAHDAIIVRAADGMITFWNPGAEEMYGWPHDEAIGRVTHTLLRTEFPVPLAEIEAALERDGWWSGILTHTCRDGSRLFVASRWAVKRGDGITPIVLEINRDVTARKRAEDALRESEKQLRLALASGRMGTWSWNLETNDVAWSTGLEEIHGLTPGTFAGTFEAFEHDVHPEDRGLVRDSVRRAFEAGGEHHIEYRIIRPDGAVRWVEGTGQLLRNPDGAPLRLLGICRDVTDRKLAEEALRASEQALKTADRRKDEFLATLGHELRNPLAPIAIAAQLLQSDDPELLREMGSLIARQVRIMVRLVDDLLDVSRIAEGKLDLRRERADLMPILQSAIEISRPSIDQFEHQLVVDLPGRAVFVEADAVRLAQVFANLLNNAAKFTDPRGRLELTATVANEDVEVSVRDNGIGIPPELLPRVFEMFEQGGANARGGLGIGLTLVKRLVEMHDGSIEARSEGIPGRGSEFIVRLPARGGRRRPDGADGGVAGIVQSS
ncbi:MAG: PAS domain-containing sensor histidine kinase [Thermoanaerobaculia bacterium]